MLNKLVQTNFTAGELSPQMYGRSDYNKFSNGVKTLSGFIPTTVGDAYMRPGTRYVAKAIDETVRSYFFEFRYNADDVYIIEMGGGYTRFYRDRAQITTDAVATGATWTAGVATVTIPAHTIRVGTEIVVSAIDPSGYNGTHIVTAVTATTVSYAVVSDPGTYVAGGVVTAPYEIASPYADYQLADVKYTQSADILFLAHPEVNFQELQRTNDTSWAFVDFDFQDGPFLAENTTATTMNPSAATGTITITASAATFASTDVGRLIRLNHGSTWGYAKITVFTTNVLVTAEVQEDFTATTAVTKWQLGYFYTNNQPWTCTFHQQRLFLGGCDTHPNAIFASETADFNLFRQTGTADSIDDTVNDANGFVFLLDANDVQSVRFMKSIRKGMAIGTDSGPWILGSRSEFDPITPTNVSTVKQTPDAANKTLRAFQAGEAMLFMQRSGEVMREFAYSFDNDQYRAIDLNQIADHMLKNDSVTDMCIQREPDTVLWMATESGELKALTYERAQEVVAWHRHQLGGTDAAVESVATMRDDPYDLVWCCVKRTINGATRRYIEFIEDPWRPSSGVEEAFYVDSGLTYSGAATTTISGLEHLNGETVDIVADGQSVDQGTVSNGQITLNRAASVVHVGLFINRDIVLMPLVAESRSGDHRGDLIQPQSVTFLVNDSTVFTYGNGTEFDEVLLRLDSDDSDTPQDAFSGYVTSTFPFGYDLDHDPTIRQDKPLPLNIAQIASRYEIGGTSSYR